MRFVLNQSPLAVRSNLVWRFCVRGMERLLEGVDGWCTPFKAAKLYELASQSDCQLAVEIGVFGGKSLLPIALAFQEKGSGSAYGIEAWDNAVAVETVTSEINDKW